MYRVSLPLSKWAIELVQVGSTNYFTLWNSQQSTSPQDQVDVKKNDMKIEVRPQNIWARTVCLSPQQIWHYGTSSEKSKKSWKFSEHQGCQTHARVKQNRGVPKQINLQKSRELTTALVRVLTGNTRLYWFNSLTVSGINLQDTGSRIQNRSRPGDRGSYTEYLQSTESTELQLHWWASRTQHFLVGRSQGIKLKVIIDSVVNYSKDLNFPIIIGYDAKAHNIIWYSLDTKVRSTYYIIRLF